MKVVNSDTILIDSRVIDDLKDMKKRRCRMTHTRGRAV